MAVHQELVKSESFDIKFKNLLRDYYSYGFKDCALEYDRKRLDNILSDYVVWSRNKDRVKFLSVDSQSMPENPFHRLYHFCSYNAKYPVIFLHTLAALNQQIKINNIEDLDIEDIGERESDRLVEILDACGKRKKRNGSVNAPNGSSSRAKDLKWKTSDLLLFYPRDLYVGLDKNKSVNERLDDLAWVGIVQLEQNQGKKGGPGDRCWSLPDRTLAELMRAGTEADRDFERHFRCAVDFFSGYFPFGEVGMYLADRMREGEQKIRPFRFKHQYFMYALNDVNRLDLLRALEEKKWCLIKYRHGTADWETSLLCYPLEIRSSAISGREYMMFYEPFHRSYSGLRIEFIDSISCFEDAVIRDILLNTGSIREAGQIDSDIQNAREALKMTWGVSAPDAQNGNAVLPVTGHTVELWLKFDPKKEWYMVRRLMRERRFGHVTIMVRKCGKVAEVYDPEKEKNIRKRLIGTPEFFGTSSEEKSAEFILQFRVTVTDPKELVSFIRGYYKRIVYCTGVEANSWSVLSDAAAWHKALTEPIAVPAEGNNVQAGNKKVTDDIWSIPGNVLRILERYRVKGEPGQHEKLFHEVFSVYYQILEDLFTQIASSDSRLFSEAEIHEMLEKSIKKYQNQSGRKTREVFLGKTRAKLTEEIREILIANRFLVEAGSRSGVSSVKLYRPVYWIEPRKDFGRDFVPLSEMEIAWLKSILRDSMIRIFLNDREIAAMEKMLDDPARAGTIQPLLLEYIREYDRFRFLDHMREKERKVLPKLLTGIYEQRVLRIRYCTGNGEWRGGGKYRPLIVEFDKRNNRFQGCFISCKTGRIHAFNLAGIRDISLTEEGFDRRRALNDLEKYRAEKETVEIEFTDERNLPDRILTEFSPLEKTCTCDRRTGRYSLKITYQKEEKKDIAIRLMGYGAKIRFTDADCPVAREVRNHVEEQMKCCDRMNAAFEEQNFGKIRG